MDEGSEESGVSPLLSFRLLDSLSGNFAFVISFVIVLVISLENTATIDLNSLSSVTWRHIYARTCFSLADACCLGNVLKCYSPQQSFEGYVEMCGIYNC